MSTYRARARSLARSTSSSDARYRHGGSSKVDVANSFGSTYAAARYFYTRASIAGADAQFRTAVTKSFAPIRDNLTRASSLCDVHDTVESARRRAALIVQAGELADADHNAGGKAAADDNNNQVDSGQGDKEETCPTNEYRYVTRRQQRQAYMASVAYTPPKFDHKVNHYYSVLDSPYSRAPKSECYGRWRRQQEHSGGTGDTGMSARAAAIIAAHRHRRPGAGGEHGSLSSSSAGRVRYSAAYGT